MTTQAKRAKRAGLQQQNVSTYDRDIEAGQILRKPIEKLLIADGKGAIVEEFKRKIRGE